MRDKTMMPRRDKIKLKHRYFKYKNAKVANLYELVEKVSEDDENLILVDLITERCKDRRLFILNLAKTYVRDYEISKDKHFYNAAMDLLKVYCFTARELKLD